MADWDKEPGTSQTHTDELGATRGRDEANAKMDYSNESNIPDGTIRWSSASNQFQIWDASSGTWSTLSDEYDINVTRLGGRRAGNAEGRVSINNGSLNENLNADQLDSLHAGNSAGQVPISNSKHCANLNADQVDGRHAGNSGGELAVNNGQRNNNLNADLLDGKHAADFAPSSHAPRTDNPHNVTADQLEDGVLPSGRLSGHYDIDVDSVNGESVGSDGGVHTRLLANDAVTQNKVASNSVGQTELKDGAGTVSRHATGSSVSSGYRTLAGGRYGFYPEIRIDLHGSTLGRDAYGGYSYGRNWSVGNSHIETSYHAQLDLQVGTQGGSSDVHARIYARQYYVQSSPPYDLGDGDCALFVELDLSPNGEVLGTYVAPDPVWANNGPTDIRPDVVENGRGYKWSRQPEITRADVKAGRADMNEYTAALREARWFKVPVDAEFKNLDMPMYPHSWPEGPAGTVVMLDPVSTRDLLELHNEGEDIAKLIHDGYIVPDNTPLRRKGPNGVMVVGYHWK